MQTLGEDSPLLLRIKLKHPRIDSNTVESIRLLSERKLSARSCSLREALLIHKALALLEKEASRACSVVTPTECDFDVEPRLLQQDNMEQDLPIILPALEYTPPRRRGIRCEKRTHEQLQDEILLGKLSKARRRLGDGSCMDAVESNAGLCI